MKVINIFLKSQQVGKHRNVPDEEYDADQLARGIEIEKEHTDDEKISKEIAKDHLSEIPDYYTRLDRMERKAKEEEEEEINTDLETYIIEKLIMPTDEEISKLKSATQDVEEILSGEGNNDKVSDEDDMKDEKQHISKLKQAMKNIDRTVGINLKFR